MAIGQVEVHSEVTSLKQAPGPFTASIDTCRISATSPAAVGAAARFHRPESNSVVVTQFDPIRSYGVGARQIAAIFAGAIGLANGERWIEQIEWLIAGLQQTRTYSLADLPKMLRSDSDRYVAELQIADRDIRRRWRTHIGSRRQFVLSEAIGYLLDAMPFPAATRDLLPPAALCCLDIPVLTPGSALATALFAACISSRQQTGLRPALVLEVPPFTRGAGDGGLLAALEAFEKTGDLLVRGAMSGPVRAPWRKWASIRAMAEPSPAVPDASIATTYDEVTSHATLVRTWPLLKLRPVPTIRDRLAQAAVVNALTPVTERLFLDCSYAYRPGRNAHHAITALERARDAGFSFVVNADVRNCFDSLDHTILFSALTHVIPDPEIIALLRIWTQMPFVERGELKPPATRGVPQGAPVSPMLANVYLHALDIEMLKLGLPWIRYADDFLCLARTKEEAAGALTQLRAATSALRLSLKPAPSHIIHFDEGFEFLGFHFRQTAKRIATRRLVDLQRKIVRRLSMTFPPLARLRKVNEIIVGFGSYYHSREAPIVQQLTSFDRWCRQGVRQILGPEFVQKVRFINAEVFEHLL
ncbi:MAG TPA: reverse transcriptase domain-containing protein [Thermoanaerobaculia bacterium]|nr:reverse transcriptase domain-containing protein [Thermoanaerobaculia bacterium]